MCVASIRFAEGWLSAFAIPATVSRAASCQKLRTNAAIPSIDEADEAIPRRKPRRGPSSSATRPIGADRSAAAVNEAPIARPIWVADSPTSSLSCTPERTGQEDREGTTHRAERYDRPRSTAVGSSPRRHSSGREVSHSFKRPYRSGATWPAEGCFRSVWAEPSKHRIDHIGRDHIGNWRGHDRHRGDAMGSPPTT